MRYLHKLVKKAPKHEIRGSDNQNRPLTDHLCLRMSSSYIHVQLNLKYEVIKHFEAEKIHIGQDTGISW